MVQDLGYKYLHMCHEMAITRVNLKDHSHRDVAHKLMDEVNSSSLEASNYSHRLDEENLWMCGVSKEIMVMDGLKG